MVVPRPPHVLPPRVARCLAALRRCTMQPLMPVGCNMHATLHLARIEVATFSVLG